MAKAIAAFLLVVVSNAACHRVHLVQPTLRGKVCSTHEIMVVDEDQPEWAADVTRGAIARWNAVIGRELLRWGGVVSVDDEQDDTPRGFIVVRVAGPADMASWGKDFVGLCTSRVGFGCMNGAAVWLPPVDPDEDATLLDNIAAHEIGHAFGLSHHPEMGHVMSEEWTDEQAFEQALSVSPGTAELIRYVYASE